MDDIRKNKKLTLNDVEFSDLPEWLQNAETEMVLGKLVRGKMVYV